MELLCGLLVSLLNMELTPTLFFCLLFRWELAMIFREIWDGGVDLEFLQGVEEVDKGVEDSSSGVLGFMGGRNRGSFFRSF